MAYISYIFFRIIVFVFQLIPFWFVYRISDGLQFLFRHVFKYRRGLIEENLKLCFPEKSDVEINDLIKGVYANFCDILLEGIKGMGMSDQQIVKRYKVLNPEVLQPYFDKGQDVILSGGHYNNWEWGVSLGLQFSHYVVVSYKPIKNKHINAYVERSRAFDNLSTVRKNDTYRYLNNPDRKLTCLALIADQSPSKVKTAHWFDFLGRDTAFLNGPDTIARQYNMPLLFLDMQRAKRGYYEMTVSVLHDDPTTSKPKELTQLYAAKLEEMIRLKPENWLWTHNRWKRKR